MATKQLVWHYTTGENFALIWATGEIRPATDYVAEGERPIVWFTAEPVWEPTAGKALYVVGMPGEDNPEEREWLDMEGTAKYGRGLVRIGVDRATAPYDWPMLPKHARMSPGMATALAGLAAGRGSDPNMWCGCLRPVPESQWRAVELWRDSAWVPHAGIETADVDSLKSLALLLEDTNRPEIRELLKSARVIFGHDTETDSFCVLYGTATYEETAAGREQLTRREIMSVSFWV